MWKLFVILRVQFMCALVLVQSLNVDAENQVRLPGEQEAGPAFSLAAENIVSGLPLRSSEAKTRTKRFLGIKDGINNILNDASEKISIIQDETEKVIKKRQKWLLELLGNADEMQKAVIDYMKYLNEEGQKTFEDLVATMENIQKELQKKLEELQQKLKEQVNHRLTSNLTLKTK